MMRLISRLFSRKRPAIAEARPGDAAAIAALHGVSFRRGWGEDEILRLLLERNVGTQRMTVGGKLIAFIMSRLVAGETEILPDATAPAWRGRGLPRATRHPQPRGPAGPGPRAAFPVVASR